MGEIEIKFHCYNYLGRPIYKTRWNKYIVFVENWSEFHYISDNNDIDSEPGDLICANKLKIVKKFSW